MMKKIQQLELTKIAHYLEPVVLEIRPDGMRTRRRVAVFTDAHQAGCGRSEDPLCNLSEEEFTAAQIETAERNGYLLALLAEQAELYEEQTWWDGRDWKSEHQRLYDAEAAQWLVRNGHEHPELAEAIAELEV
ncbi:MAG TPA: hypothetical protein VJL59_12235 [Anaerolineales bacterium]|nr:hypothetical protein [Anaerolineales bacterium]